MAAGENWPLPEERPPYIDQAHWTQLQSAPASIAAEMLRQIEVATADDRACAVRSGLLAAQKAGQSFEEVMVDHGGSEELEKLIGPASLRRLREWKDDSDLGVPLPPTWESSPQLPASFWHS